MLKITLQYWKPNKKFIGGKTNSLWKAIESLKNFRTLKKWNFQQLRIRRRKRRIYSRICFVLESKSLLRL